MQVSLIGSKDECLWTGQVRSTVLSKGNVLSVDMPHEKEVLRCTVDHVEYDVRRGTANVFVTKVQHVPHLKSEVEEPPL